MLSTGVPERHWNGNFRQTFLIGFCPMQRNWNGRELAAKAGAPQTGRRYGSDEPRRTGQNAPAADGGGFGERQHGCETKEPNAGFVVRRPERSAFKSPADARSKLPQPSGRQRGESVERSDQCRTHRRRRVALSTHVHAFADLPIPSTATCRPSMRRR